MTAAIIKIITITVAIATGIHIGANTHNQLQLITPINFSVINNNPNKHSRTIFAETIHEIWQKNKD